MSDDHGGTLEAELETQDPKAPDAGSDDEEDEEDAGGVSDGQQEGSGGESKEGGGETANGTGKKKKKKQKKRKKKGAGGGSSDSASSGSASPGASPPTSPSANSAPSASFPPSSSADAPLCQPDLDDMLPVEVAEKRFAAALESMRSKADLCMWVQLARCRVGDKKLRRLTDALIHCETVTSVDLSENLISDAGLRQLACALSAPSAAPDLISLNVKRNPISASGRACLANLQAVRKLVRIEYEESPPPAAQEKKGAQGGKGQGMADPRGFESGERMGGGLASKASNPQIRIDAAVRFIREASEKLQQMAPEGSSRRSIATRVFDSSMMTEALEDVVELVDADLRRNPSKSYHNSPINKLPLPLRLVVESLPTFASLLELPIPPQQCQRKLAEPAAGRHRILAVLLLRKVLGACGRVVDDRLAREDLGRKVAALLFDFPWSNVLHHGVLGACRRVVDDRLAREGVGRKVAALLFDFPWSNVLHHGVCCFLMVRAASSWYVLLPHGMCCFLMVRAASSWYVLLPHGTCCILMVRAASSWYVLLPHAPALSSLLQTKRLAILRSSVLLSQSQIVPLFPHPPLHGASIRQSALERPNSSLSSSLLDPPLSDDSSSSTSSTITALSSSPALPSSSPPAATTRGDEGAVRKARGSGQGEGEADPRPQVDVEPEAKRGRVNGEKGEAGGKGGAEEEGTNKVAEVTGGGAEEGGSGTVDSEAVSNEVETVEREGPGEEEKGAEDKGQNEDKGKGDKREEGEGNSKGEGEGEKQAAASAAASDPTGPSGPLALPVRLAVTAAPWVNTSIGQRPGHAGPIIQLMFDIRGRATTSAPLQAKLEKLPEWQVFAQAGGQLDELLSQQHGALCGPKPVVPGSDVPDMGAGSGGQSMLFGEPDLPPSFPLRASAMDFHLETTDSQQILGSSVLLSRAASEPCSSARYRAEDPGGPPYKTRRIRSGAIAPAADSPMAAASVAAPQEPAVMAVRINRPDLQSLTDVVNADGHAWLKYGEKRISKNTVMRFSANVARETRGAAAGENCSPVSQQFASTGSQPATRSLWSPISIDDSPIGPLDAALSAAMSLRSSPASSPLASPLSVGAPCDACDRASARSSDSASDRASERASTAAYMVMGLGESEALRGNVEEESRHVTDMAMTGGAARAGSTHTSAGAAFCGAGAAACFPVLAAMLPAAANATENIAATADPWSGNNRVAVSARVSELHTTRMGSLVRADGLAWGGHGGGEQGGVREHADGAAPAAAAAMAAGPARARISACAQGTFLMSRRCCKQEEQGEDEKGEGEHLSLDLSLSAPGTLISLLHLRALPSFRFHPSTPFLPLPSFRSPPSSPLLPLPSFRSPPSAPLLPLPSFRSRPSAPLPPHLPLTLSVPSPYSSSGSFRPFLRPFALGALMGSLLVTISLLSANPPRADPSAAVASASGAGGAGTLGVAGAKGDAESGASYTGPREGELFLRGDVTSGVVTSNVVTMSSSGGALDAVDSLPGLSEGFGLALTDLEQRMVHCGLNVSPSARAASPLRTRLPDPNTPRDPTRLALQLSNRQLAALIADVAQWRARSGASMDRVLSAAREPGSACGARGNGDVRGGVWGGGVWGGGVWGFSFHWRVMFFPLVSICLSPLRLLSRPLPSLRLLSRPLPSLFFSTGAPHPPCFSALRHPTRSALLAPLLLSFLRPPNTSTHPTAAALSAALTVLLPILPASVSSLTAAAAAAPAAASGDAGGGEGGEGGRSGKAGREGGVWRGGVDGMERCMALMCQVERQQMIPPDSRIICSAPSVHTAAREEYDELVRERRAWEVVGLHWEWVEARREWMGPARSTMEALQRLMSMPPGSGIFRKLFDYIFWLRPYVALFRSIPTPALSSLSSLRLSSIRSSLSLDGRQAASTLNAARSSLLSSLRTLSSRCGVDAGGEFWTDMHDAALQRYRWVAEAAFDKWCVDWAAVGGGYRQRAGMVVPGEVWRREGLHGGGMEKDIEKGLRGTGGSESERDLERQGKGGDKGAVRADEGGGGTEGQETPEANARRREGERASVGRMGPQPEFSFLLLPDPLSPPPAVGKGGGLDARAVVEVVVGCMRHVGFNASGSGLGVPAELLVLLGVGREGQRGQAKGLGGVMGQGGVENGEGGEGGEWERVAAWSQAAWAVEEQGLTVLPVVVPSFDFLARAARGKVLVLLTGANAEALVRRAQGGLGQDAGSCEWLLVLHSAFQGDARLAVAGFVGGEGGGEVGRDGKGLEGGMGGEGVGGKGGGGEAGVGGVREGGVEQRMREWGDLGRERHSAANLTGPSSSGSSTPPPPLTYTGWVQGTPLAVRRSALLSLGSLGPLHGGGMGGAGEGQGVASSSSSRVGAWVLCVRAWLAGYRVGLVRSPSAEFLFPKHDASRAGSRVGGGSNHWGNVGVGSGSDAAAGLHEFAALVAPYMHAVKERIAILNSH
ncbi:unnamed protein product [Closterium sp. NIES-64]|nr:unnamed protein product [Closterium sp. NIES-64]